MVAILLGLAVLISAMLIDYAEARYVVAVTEGRAHLAARWSLMMWALGCLGFVVVLRESLWYSLPEGLGFYAGTLIAVRRDCRAR